MMSEPEIVRLTEPHSDSLPPVTVTTTTAAEINADSDPQILRMIPPGV